jgi:hypothetical protein
MAVKPYRFFIHWTDLIHFVLGLIAGLLKPSYISLVILAVYTIYQTLERESIAETTTDFVEFIIGFLFGETIPSLVV